MSQTTIKISFPSISARNWETLAQLKAVFSDEEIVTMVHRYCDAQDHAKNYRTRRADEFKRLKALDKAGKLDGSQEVGA